MSRRVRVPIYGGVLALLFEDGAETRHRIIDGIAPGARAICFVPGPREDVIELIVEHESYEDIAPGQLYPLRPVVFGRVES